jgi:hypothetical protein
MPCDFRYIIVSAPLGSEQCIVLSYSTLTLALSESTRFLVTVQSRRHPSQQRDSAQV